MGFFLKFFWYGLLLSGGGWTALKIVEFSDVYKVIHKNVPGPCKYLPGIEHGAEDIEVLPNGIAILSTGLEFTRQAGAKDSKPGVLKSFDFNKPNIAPKELKISGFKGHLNPHGISTFTEGGKTFVYLVNHPPFNEAPPADSIEKFLWDVEKGTLTHQKTFSDEQFLGLNDVVAVGLDKFYVSNYMTMTSPIMQTVEMALFAVPLQNVVYFDGQKGTVVLNGLYGANGLTTSPDRKYLYVSEVTKKRLSSYRIESPTKLVHVDSKSLGTVPDNHAVDPETGDLWVGCHPVVYQLMGALWSNSSKTAPSQVLRVGVKDGKFRSVAEIYSDDGSVLMASTVAVPYKGSMLVGTVQHKALHCKLAGLNSIVKLK